MRFHVSNIVTKGKVLTVASSAGVSISDISEHGSRSHDHAFEIKLSGNSHRMQNNGSGERAATFDEWGKFIELLYRIDPTMYAANAYFDYHHFVWTYNDRYGMMIDRPEEIKMHKQHRWEFSGYSITNTYTVQACECGAILRRVTVRHSEGERSVDAWHRITAEI